MAMTKVMNLGVEVKVNSKGAITGLKQVGAQVEMTGKKAKSASAGVSKLTGAMGALGIAVGAAGVYRALSSSLTAFGNFEEQLKNVQNITSSSTAEMGMFKNQLEQLPSTLGSSVDLTKGLYQALSSGVPKDNAIDFMVVNARAAKGNLADLTQTISASTSILAAFSLDASKTGDVLDAMTKTVDLGKLTFSDLANNIGKSASIAAAAGVSYNELFAATAQLTLGGLSVEESMTGIRAIMTATISPTVDQAKAMKKYGVELSATALQQQGFVGYMESIARAVGSNVEAMAELFPNVRAIGPALALAREDGAQFDKILQQIEGSAGKVQSNFENMSASLKAQQAALKIEFQKMAQQLGEELAPAFLRLAQVAAEILPPITEFVVTVIEQMGYLADSISWVSEKIAFVWTSTSEESWQGWKVIIIALTAAIAALTIATGALSISLGPITLIAIGMAAAIAGLELEARKLEERFASMAYETKEITDANERLNQGLAANAMTYPMLRDEMGLTVAEGENLVEAVREELEARIENGTATEKQMDIYKGMKHVTEEMAAAATASAKAVEDSAKKSKKAMEGIRKELADLRQGFEEFDKTQEKLKNQQIPELWTDLLFGVEAVDEALWSSIDGWVANERSVSDFVRVGSDGVWEFTDEYLEALQQAMAGTNIAFKEELPEAVEEGTKAANNIISNDLITDDTMTGPKESIFGGIVGGLSDALGQGFMGEWDSFSDLWDSLWQDAAKSMVGIIGDAFSDLLNGGSLTGEGGFFDTIQSEAGIGSTVGGIGMVMQAREQGGAQGAMQGAMGGMMAGAIAGPIGMAVGAIAGGLIGYFGGDDPPRTSIAVGPRNSIWSSDDSSDEEEDVWAGKARSLYDKLEGAYRGIFLMFEDSELGDMLRTSGRLPVVDTGGMVDNMSSEDMFEWLQSEALPEAFEAYYKPIFEEGLSGLGVNNATIDALFEKLPDLSGDARIQLLADFVSTVVDLSHSMENADWDTFTASLDLDSTQSFQEGMGEITEQMDLMMNSWRGMGLDDVIREVGAIGDAFDTALEGVAEMLYAIDDTRQSIMGGWSSLSEEVMLSTMNEGQQIGYFEDQLEKALQDLENADSLEAIEAANAEVERYLREIMGMEMYDPTAMVDPFMGDGTTWADYVQSIIDRAESAASSGLDDVEDIVNEAYDQLVARLERASDALLNFADAADKSTSDDTGLTTSTDLDLDKKMAAEIQGQIIADALLSKELVLSTPDLYVTLNATMDGNPMRAEVDQNMQAMWDAFVAVIEERTGPNKVG